MFLPFLCRNWRFIPLLCFYFVFVHSHSEFVVEMRIEIKIRCEKSTDNTQHYIHIQSFWSSTMNIFQDIIQYPFIVKIFSFPCEAFFAICSFILFFIIHIHKFTKAILASLMMTEQKLLSHMTLFLLFFHTRCA